MPPEGYPLVVYGHGTGGDAGGAATGSGGNPDAEGKVYTSSSPNNPSSTSGLNNRFGSINPIEQITELADSRNAVVLVDGAQSVPHMPVEDARRFRDLALYHAESSKAAWF